MATSTPVDVGMPSLPSATSDQQEKATATKGSGQQAGVTTGSEDLEQQEHKTGEIRKQGFFKGLKEFFKGLKEYFKNLIEKFTDFFLCLKCCFSCGLCCVETWAPITATFLIYWLIYRPDRFHPRTDSAVLATFDITNDSLRYDLAVDLSFRNTHRVSIRYLDVAASMYYNGTRLGPTDDALPSFRQGPKSTIVLHPAFNGVVTVDSGVASELERERAAGTVHLRVTVSLTLMYKVLFVKDVFFYKYDCWLWFPPPSNNTPALFYGDGTKCWRV